MIAGKRILAIIPARAGSKGLPGKNIKPLWGRPLLAWTIQRALQSRHLDTVMVSTDGTQIADVAKEWGAEVPFLRPAELSSDTASSYDVIDHAVAHYRQRGVEFDYVALLEPTSPLREPGDIDNMLEKLVATGADSIVSVGEVGEHPSIMKRLVGDHFEPFYPTPAQNLRRQDYQPAYFPYGVAYIGRTDRVLSERSFYLANAVWYRIKDYQTYEIDDLYDFLCVEAVMRHEWRVDEILDRRPRVDGKATGTQPQGSGS